MNNEESPHKNVSLLDVLYYCRNSWSKLHFLIMNTSNHNLPPPVTETVTQVFPVKTFPGIFRLLFPGLKNGTKR